MDFSSLRPSSPLYILTRNDIPSVNVGSIVNVSAPFASPGVQPVFGQQPAMVVNISVEVDGKQGQFAEVPANADYNEYKNKGVPTPYVLSTSREAINTEIGRLRKQAVGIIESVPHNEKVIAACDEILQRLNPEVAEKQRQEKEIADLRSQVAELISLLKGGGEKATKEERQAKNK